MAVLQITCDHCGASFSFTTLPAIDTGADPAWKEKVRNGRAFAAACPHCGDTKYYDYSFLYKERESQTLLYYAANEEDFLEACRIMTGRSDEVPWASIATWRRRVVANRAVLSEKLMILDAGLDDRFVEMEKVLAYSFLQKKNPSLSVDAVHFDADEAGHRRIVFLQGNEIVAAYGFDMDLYRKLENTFAAVLKKTERDDILIDSEWAVKVMNQ